MGAVQCLAAGPGRCPHAPPALSATQMWSSSQVVSWFRPMLLCTQGQGSSIKNVAMWAAGGDRATGALLRCVRVRVYVCWGWCALVSPHVGLYARGVAVRNAVRCVRPPGCVSVFVLVSCVPAHHTRCVCVCVQPASALLWLLLCAEVAADQAGLGAGLSSEDI